MNQTTSKQIRVLAIALTARALVLRYGESSDSRIWTQGGRGNKNSQSVYKLEKLLNNSCQVFWCCKM